MWLAGVVVTAAVVAGAAAGVRATVEPGELERIVRELRRADLPADLVVNKVLEGTAKGVPRERILAAARGLSNEIRLVARVVHRHELPPLTDRHAIVRAGVAAHVAGIPLPGIDRIVAAGGQERGAAAVAGLYAAADLRANGYPTEPTVDLVVALTARTAFAEELGRVLAVTEAARHRSGRQRRDVAERLAAAVSAGGDLTAAARSVTGTGN